MTTGPITLPPLPKDKEFEEYISSIFQSAGYFVERNLIERDQEEILELDIIATRYNPTREPVESLIEVKSGGWGFSDVFKIRGWATYLDIKDAKLIVCRRKEQHGFYRQKTYDIGVELCYHSNDTADEAHSELLQDLPAEHSVEDVPAWRFSYWAERQLLRKLSAKKKSSVGIRRYDAIESYLFTVNSGIFFSTSVLDRVKQLYDAFKVQPHFSAKVGSEASGEPFDLEHTSIPDAIFRKTFYQSKLTDLTYSTYVEYRARLALPKACVDFILYDLHDNKTKTRDRYAELGWGFSLKQFLPETFFDGLKKLCKQPYFHNYPTFWQQFLWLFGGFILEDYKELEYEMLSKRTGIPTDFVEEALGAFDVLFPTSGGWFSPPDSSKSNIRILKLYPGIFRGIGANFRKHIYGKEDAGYDALHLKGSYTCRDLVKWHNLVYEILSAPC